MKAVAYCGTRNLYKNMAMCVKSCLQNGNVDRIYLLIEDDTFPYDLGDKVVVKNVSGQTYFPPSGVNYNCEWTYMVLMKCALSKVFPRLDRILMLDCDTLVEHDLSELWELDMTDYYYAAVPQTRTTYPSPYDKQPEDFIYINAGSLFCNLKKLRKDKKDDEIIASINSNKYRWAEQDCISELCQGHIKVLSGRWNQCDFTPTDHLATYIRHFAANKWWPNTTFGRRYEIDD